MANKNALWNCQNPNQGNYPKHLCVCSAGLLRSPTMAYVLNKKGYNVRAAGLYDYALIRVDEVLIEWAGHIWFAEQEHLNYFKKMFPEIKGKSCTVLNLPDKYEYRHPELIAILEDKFKGLREYK